MVRRPTCTEIAGNYSLWGSHVDPDGNMTEAEFDEMDFSEKLDLIHDLWPQDCNCGEEDEGED